ncbi:Ubiquitinconjugating enzyme subfamily protein [Pelomyxa schiedti]|nr:Ubiquitinconjugating enzyme subfamily protein [Pelomyxa schiedti]
MAASTGATATPTVDCVKRLKKEWQEILQSPIDHVLTRPHPENILEWHYVLLGPMDTVYQGGIYWGIVRFPPTYPLAPPSIIMKTPSGRFATDKKLCLSMSDFHPESWVPSWSVSSILLGLLSFMLEQSHTVGSIETTDTEKRNLAKGSVDWNRKQPQFAALFPSLLTDPDDEDDNEEDS